MNASPRPHGLSKSKITYFEQCPKRLWLSVHRADLAEIDEGAEARFATGHEVGAAACSLLPGGIMVEAEPDLSTALATTKALLEGGHQDPIFEATFQHDGVLVRVDILEPNGIGGWHMAEVKSSTKPKDYHVNDLATQVWVAREAGVSIDSAAIRHLDGDFVLASDGSLEGLFSDSDLTSNIKDRVETRAEVVAAARETLAGTEPDILPGSHCNGLQCNFATYCEEALPPGPEWPVTVLPYGGGNHWLKKGIANLLDVDPAMLTNPTHQRVYQATVTGEPNHDVEGARFAMADWSFPRTWLDFETIAFAIPRWIGTRPYQQVPFQFSAHIEAEDGNLQHHEFLSLDGMDPRRACAEALVTMIPNSGAVVTYNEKFEKARLRELSEFFPDLADDLNSIIDRVVDLLPVTRANWYHRDQRGSWSIKAVLPTIAPDLDYSQLEVKDGGNAQAAYLEAISPDTTDDRRTALDKALRAYCERDTQAMIVLAKHLTQS
ncbi:DUF2779 domain-containing protein [Sphingobium yanoikuyae]|uniref:DUF2779 domain-containing protein n=1 Tax=Sphingobium yanoikuyae TaxID=13690 RepID=A0A430BLN1_SPHYA|nr:DUF2779 domain-containing protein [Sphingobium yanoikuyae]MDG2515920.1 DUF2779 domain-containing protein [Sphingobium yanoikuyae]RSU52488.1 DUF2779 domain-containing protein [Sphingobium yanoikuyae]